MKYKATVYIVKATTGYYMRYGEYETFHEAADAVRLVKSINTIDEVIIEERYI